jgi:hypothetical protein
LDSIHENLSGPATKKLCERLYPVFGDQRYERLSTIANGHLYNLRKEAAYVEVRQVFQKTRSTKVQIGVRRKPFPNGVPGFHRVDSVHQGELDGIKGVYLINAVDEVTQMQCIVAVECISELFLIPAPLADRVSEFTLRVLTPYINFHRPCFFAYEQEDARGKIRKKYRYQDMMTPYEKLRSLPQNRGYPKPGMTFEELDAFVSRESDNKGGLELQKARRILFQTINKKSQRSAA